MIGHAIDAPTISSEEATQVRLAKRDRQAFAPLYLRYFDRVYAYCYRRLGGPEEAADATSVVFARALASLSSCREEAFRSWLFAIAHNVLIDEYRGRRPSGSLDEASEVIDRGPGPEEIAIEGETKRTVSDLLSALSDDQRQVLELRLAGLTSKEIGQVLDRHPNAVDQLQFRAMTRLRQLSSRGESRTEVIP
jgi:RNA polymerase sigma-70 factor (ECF subfamily)